MKHNLLKYCKHLSLTLAFSVPLCLTACLDEHLKDQVSADEAYDSASSLYVNAVASLYNYIGSNQEGEGLQGTCRGVYDYNTLTTLLISAPRPRSFSTIFS